MATLIASIANTLEEKIDPSIHESLWKLDPIFPMIRRSSMGVVQNRGIGKGFAILKTWVTGVAGGARFRSALGSNTLVGTGTAPKHFTVYDTPDSFPGVDETSAPAFIQTTTQLIEQQGNFYLPHTILRADRLNASIGSVVAENLKGVGMHLALQESAVWYSTATTTFALASMGNVATSVANGDTTDSIVLSLGDTTASTNGTLPIGRVHRFLPGMLVDLYNSAGTVKRNSTFYVYVDNVDPLARTLTLRRTDGGEFQITTVLNGGATYATADTFDDDIIVIKDSVALAPNSLETFMPNGVAVGSGGTGTDFFGIDVTDYGQYKSYNVAVSAALTERFLNRHVGWYHEAFPGRDLDCAITTMGVINGFIDNLDALVAGSNSQDGRMRYDRNGKALDVEAGWNAFHYRFASRPLEIYTSTLCANGVFYAGKIKNGGITRYVPPALPGVKADSRFGAEVEFIAGLGQSGGYMGGIFKHAHSNSGATTNMIEAPFVRQWNCMPTQPNWLRLHTITEVLGA